MRRQEETTPVLYKDSNNNTYRSKPTFIDRLYLSFRDFIENAE
jgi:hypothetical protein